MKDKMAIYINKYHESDNMAVASGSPITPTIDEREMTIPDGKTWAINKIGGSSSHNEAEVELLYSEDGGTTWINPFDDQANKLYSAHLSGGIPIEVIMEPGFEFTGNGTNVRLKIRNKNYNTVNQNEVIFWLQGYEK